MNMYTIILIGLSILLLLFITGVWGVKRYIYFQPDKTLIDSQEPYTDVTSGTVHGRLYSRKKSNRLVIFCHGNAGNLSHRDHKITPLLDMNVDVLIFDYSGYGKSKGFPSEEICYQNAISITQKMIREYELNDMIMYGESLGGPIAMYTVNKLGVPYIILESCLSSMKDVVY